MGKKFSDLGVKSSVTNFQGDKVKIDRIINVKVVVHDYKVEPSKHYEGGKYLCLQVEYNGEKRIVFTGSASLINMIEQVRREDFPFETTIVKDDRRLEFS